MAGIEDIQREIIAMAPAEVRMLLYRRAMLRVANVVRGQEGALATVLGDAVGQVASQTLQNLGAVYEAGDPPVIAPCSTRCASSCLSGPRSAAWVKPDATMSGRVGTERVHVPPRTHGIANAPPARLL